MKRKYEWWGEWGRLQRENPPTPPEIKALAAQIIEAMAVWAKHVKPGFLTLRPRKETE